MNPPNSLRSTGAVLVGLIVIFVLSLGTDVVLHTAGIYPPWFTDMAPSLWFLSFAYRAVYGILGAYVTARLAPSLPMRHAMILAGIGLVLSTLGAIGTWNKGPEFGPHWYPLSLIAQTIPCCWIGAKLRLLQISKEVLV
ncbi:MAG: hypothetical protein JWM43_1781 [Acidobacteriaceae bacterium]|nr:hypothetical protein [Acidobacteriaceae bacterium]